MISSIVEHQIKPGFIDMHEKQFCFSTLKNLDGMDLWEALSKDLESSRTSVVHNIDDIWSSAAITVGKWKILKGTLLTHIYSIICIVVFELLYQNGTYLFLLYIRWLQLPIIGIDTCVSVVRYVWSLHGTELRIHRATTPLSPFHSTCLIESSACLVYEQILSFSHTLWHKLDTPRRLQFTR